MAKKLTREERATLPAIHGLAGKIAMTRTSKRHKNKIKYNRKQKHKESQNEGL